MSTNKTLCLFVFLMIVGSSVIAQETISQDSVAEETPLWAREINVSSMNIDEIRTEYSLWSLLSEGGAKTTHKSKVVVDIEAYFINPITYVHLRGDDGAELKKPEALKNEMGEIYEKNTVIYILLKSEEDEDALHAGDWDFALVTLDQGEIKPQKIDATEPEYVFGYSGDFYETKILLFFPKQADGDHAGIGVLEGDYISASNKKYKIKEEVSWVASSINQMAANPVTQMIIKVFLSVLFILLVLLIVLSRPPQRWFRKKA